MFNIKSVIALLVAVVAALAYVMPLPNSTVDAKGVVPATTERQEALCASPYYQQGRTVEVKSMLGVRYAGCPSVDSPVVVVVHGVIVSQPKVVHGSKPSYDINQPAAPDHHVDHSDDVDPVVVETPAPEACVSTSVWHPCDEGH